MTVERRRDEPPNPDPSSSAAAAGAAERRRARRSAAPPPPPTEIECGAPPPLLFFRRFRGASDGYVGADRDRCTAPRPLAGLPTVTWGFRRLRGGQTEIECSAPPSCAVLPTVRGVPRWRYRGGARGGVRRRPRPSEAGLNSIALRCIALCCVTLHCVALRCVASYIALRYITLHRVTIVPCLRAEVLARARLRPHQAPGWVPSCHGM